MKLIRIPVLYRGVGVGNDKLDRQTYSASSTNAQSGVVSGIADTLGTIESYKGDDSASEIRIEGNIEDTAASERCDTSGNGKAIT